MIKHFAFFFLLFSQIMSGKTSYEQRIEGESKRRKKNVYLFLFMSPSRISIFQLIVREGHYSSVMILIKLNQSVWSMTFSVSHFFYFFVLFFHHRFEWGLSDVWVFFWILFFACSSFRDIDQITEGREDFARLVDFSTSIDFSSF